MFSTFPSVIFRVIGGSFALWIVSSTIIPQIYVRYADKQIQSSRFHDSSYPYNSLVWPTENPIQNSSVYFVIAHPDDEVMFFSPTILESLKPKNSNQVHLVCLSNGDAIDQSLGVIRENELYSSARILGFQPQHITVLSEFKDGMNEAWNTDKIVNILTSHLSRDKSKAPKMIITFDSKGVSNHPNHIALHHGSRKFVTIHNRRASQPIKMFALKSLNFWEKYSFTLVTNIELFLDHFTTVIRKFFRVNIHIKLANKGTALGSSLKIYSDLNMLSASYAAMAYGHYSQMVWFRYGWLCFSRYLNANHLFQVA